MPPERCATHTRYLLTGARALGGPLADHDQFGAVCRACGAVLIVLAFASGQVDVTEVPSIDGAPDWPSEGESHGC